MKGEPMKVILRATLLAFMCFALIGGASATTLTFDDLTGYGGLPANYGGFTWASNMGYYDSDQPPYNPQSPPERVLFNYGSCCAYAESDVTWNGPGTITFLGAYFAGYASAGPVYFNLYNGAALVWTSGSLSPSDTPTYLDAGYLGPVTKIGIVGQDGYYVMDNFTFSSVPEPGTLLMLGTGIVGLAGAIRRKLF